MATFRSEFSHAVEHAEHHLKKRGNFAVERETWVLNKRPHRNPTRDSELTFRVPEGGPIWDRFAKHSVL